MCGIAGIVAPDAAHRLETLAEMSARIAHRGPDDAGTWNDAHAALAHRRLAIIDTSAAGHQPMLSHCGRYAMVYNGELFNFVELRHRLEQHGVRFRGHSDSEVLLEAFVAWGEDCLAQCNGMWAFAIWDTVARRLFVARDRFGIKPFYYAIRDDAFVFASEIKALLANEWVDRSPEPRMLADFCAERVSDHTDLTFFRGVSQLPAGTCGWWQHGRLQLRRYWQIPADADPGQPQADLVDEISDLLEDAIRLRLRSDIPVGALLSGGLDSSGVTCIAARLASGGLAAFSTIDRDPPEEAAGIDAVLRANPGIELHRDEPPDTCLDDELEECLWHQEEPFADGSMLAHFRLMRLARASGVRVLLTGQAADEVFAGYPGYLAVHLGGLLRHGHWREAAAFRRALARSGQVPAFTTLLGHALPQRLSAFMRGRKTAAGVDWLADGYRLVSPGIARGYATAAGDPLNAALRASITQRTLPGFLHYEDRNSMAFGVETRIPYLDYRLVSKVVPLPGALKVRGGLTKALLRQALHGRVPAAITARSAKQGYPAPLARWLRSTSPAKRALRLEKVATCPIVDRTRWMRRYRRFEQGDDRQLPAVWRGLVVSLWHGRFVERGT